jgi:hypothetical protein
MVNIPADYWLTLCKIRLLTLSSATAPYGGRFPVVSDHCRILQSDDRLHIMADFNRHFHGGSDQP